MHRKPTSRAGRRSARRSHLHPTHGPNRTHRLALGLGLAKQTLARAVRHVARRVARAPNCRDANKRSPSVALPPPHLNRDVDGGRQLGSRAVPSKLGSRAKPSTTIQSRLGPSPSCVVYAVFHREVQIRPRTARAVASVAARRLQVPLAMALPEGRVIVWPERRGEMRIVEVRWPAHDLRGTLVQVA